MRPIALSCIVPLLLSTVAHAQPLAPATTTTSQPATTTTTTTTNTQTTSTTPVFIDPDADDTPNTTRTNTQPNTTTTNTTQASTNTTPPAATTTTPSTPQAPRAANATMDELSQGSTLGRGLLRFTLNFFGNVGMSGGTSLHMDQPLEQTTFSFNTANSVILFGAKLGDFLFGLSETNFEANFTEGFIIELERLELRLRSGKHSFAAGRFHTDLGFWNNAYHHGAHLQPTIIRPRMTRFEDDGGFLPNHSIGIQGTTGFVLPGGLTFDFLAGVSNGRGDTGTDIRLLNDTNAFKALNGKITLSHASAPGFQLGISALYDQIAGTDAMKRPQLPDRVIHEFIGAINLVYRGPKLTLIAEGYFIRHGGGGGVWNSGSATLVAGYKVHSMLSPYVAFEYLNVDRNDPYFRADGTVPYNQWHVVDAALGLRVDLWNWSALKFEAHLNHFPDSNFTGGAALVGWGFGI